MKIYPNTILNNIQGKPWRTNEISSKDKAILVQMGLEVDKAVGNHQLELLEKFTDYQENAQKPLTLGGALMEAIQKPIKSDEEMSGAKKTELYDLAINIFKAEQEGTFVDIPSELITILKDRLAKHYTIPIVGLCHKYMDGNLEFPQSKSK